MKIMRTIKLKLKASINDVLPTMEAYTKAFNLVSKIGYEQNEFNGINLHKLSYAQCKEFLPSQLACSARLKATEALASIRTRKKKGKKVSCPQSKLCAIRLDARSYTIWFDKNVCSILTLNGRKKFEFNIPDYYKQFITWKQCSADLVLKKDKKNRIYLHLVVSKDITDPTPELTNDRKIIGIDSGIKRIAVTSDKQFFNGGYLNTVRTRYKRLRSVLQSKRHSGKRHLKKLKTKENRFVRDVLHVVSKKIVSRLSSKDIVVMEDLTGIRDNCKLRKEQRIKVHMWPFLILHDFVKYKSENKGCLFLDTNPKNTSRECSRCGYIDKKNRKSQSEFKCVKCGNTLNADFNGSKVISLRGKLYLGKSQIQGVQSITLDAPMQMVEQTPHFSAG
jgi:putative transposase